MYNELECMIADFVGMVRSLDTENKSLKRRLAAAECRILEMERKYENDDVSRR